MIIIFPLFSLVVCAILEGILVRKLRPRVVRAAFKRKRRHAFQYVIKGQLTDPHYIRLEKETMILRRLDAVATHLPWVLPTALWTTANWIFMYFYI
jgi:hypothetical protein